FVIHFFDYTVEVSKWTITNPDHFTRLEQGLRLRLLSTVIHALQDRIRFTLSDRRHSARLLRILANKAHYLRCFLDQMPGIIIHIHFDQHIARKKLSLGLALLACLDLYHFLGRHENLTKQVLHATQFDPLLKGAFHMLFKTRIGMDDVPAL